MKDPDPHSRQGHLFGAPPAARREPDPVSPAPVAAAQVEIAARLPESLRLGTSSWSFPGWRGLVYREHADTRRLAREGLAAYARHPLLRAVGIDRTYYAPLPAEAFAAYADQVPASFRFLVKAHDDCTVPRRFTRGGADDPPPGDNPRFLDPAYAAEEVIGPYVEGLGSRAGALLFQFPPLPVEALGGPGAFAERLQRFLAALPRGPLYAVELRNASLLTPQYRAALADAGATHCLNVHPSMPTIDEQRRCVSPEDSSPLVVRWMLRSGQSFESARRRYEPFDRIVDPDDANRDSIARLCLESFAAGRPVIVITNNKAEGSAPRTVFRLAETIAARLGNPAGSPSED